MPIRVYIEDTDAGGIVFYVNYLKYLERARTELMRQLGHDRVAVLDGRLLFVVHSLEIDYLKPAVLDDMLQATAEILEVGRGSFEVAQRVWRGEELLCRARVKLACVDRERLRPRGMPARVRDTLLEQIESNQGEKIS